MLKRTRLTPAERLLTRTSKTDTCWLWRGCLDSNGYGRMQVNYETLYVHRLSWETYRGEIPRGSQIDHKCRVKFCVNPGHLKIVSNKENSENRGPGINNTSGYRGVSWINHYQKFRAQVRHNGKLHHAGMFNSAEEANRAAIAKRNELFSNNLSDVKI